MNIKIRLIYDYVCHIKDVGPLVVITIVIIVDTATDKTRAHI